MSELERAGGGNPEGDVLGAVVQFLDHFSSLSNMLKTRFCY